MTDRGMGCSGIIVVLAILFGLTTCQTIILRATDYNTTFVVKKTERITSGESSYYLVWAEDGRVFKNTDTISYLKYNSSTIYGLLEPGHTYRAKIAGWRLPFFSVYPNIIEVEELE